MKYFTVAFLIFIAGCGATKKLTFTEFKTKNAADFYIINEFCSERPKDKDCVNRESRKRYSRYLNEKSLLYRHMENRIQRFQNPQAVSPQQNIPNQGIPVYDSGACIGSVINGECNGTIQPKAGYQKRCHGQMLFGKCTGPMF